MVEHTNIKIEHPLFKDLEYLHGHGNEHESEAVPGSLPVGQNNPQKCAHDLYAEQLSGTPFTYPRNKNERSWLYKLLPTVVHKKWTSLNVFNAYPKWQSDFSDANASKGFEFRPDQMRMTPFKEPTEPTNFPSGVSTWMGIGSPSTKNGICIGTYSFNKGMTEDKLCMYSADGDILFVPWQGTLLARTEFGKLTAGNQEIIVIPRGVKFTFDVEEGQTCRGWFCEIYKGHFQIPDLGPIGSNGLANPRDFCYPVASFDHKPDEQWKVLAKFGGTFHTYEKKGSPFDVVAWHGNYAPYKYDLRKFNTMGSISFDHPDPSIFTVLTCQTEDHGQALLDFVIFPPRWLVAEKTFRPPYFHRNTMTEFMGNIVGTYDAKEKGFCAGASSLHSCMSGHGPETEVFHKASNADLKPQHTGYNSMAFMFETCYQLKVNMERFELDETYSDCWQAMEVMMKKPAAEGDEEKKQE